VSFERDEDVVTSVETPVPQRAPAAKSDEPKKPSVYRVAVGKSLFVAREMRHAGAEVRPADVGGEDRIAELVEDGWLVVDE
jgi:hypothetical protein